MADGLQSLNVIDNGKTSNMHVYNQWLLMGSSGSESEINNKKPPTIRSDVKYTAFMQKWGGG